MSDALTPYYQHGGITIYHGDCREILPQLEPVDLVDLVLTDPPYGVGFSGKKTKQTSTNPSYLGADSDLGPIVIRMCKSFASRMIVTPGNRLCFRYPEPDELGCIFCPSGAGLGRWGFTMMHPILYYGKCPYLSAQRGHRPNSFSSFKTQGPNGHPCPKPLEWMKWLVLKGSVQTSDTILDPFMGSGTTLRAAKDLGRRAIGIEIEEKYCEIAAERLRQEVLFT